VVRITGPHQLRCTRVPRVSWPSLVTLDRMVRMVLMKCYL